MEEIREGNVQKSVLRQNLVNPVQRRIGLLEVLNGFHQEAHVKKLRGIWQAINIANLNVSAGKPPLNELNCSFTLFKAVDSISGYQVLPGQMPQKLALATTEFHDLGSRGQLPSQMGNEPSIPRSKLSLLLPIVFIIPCRIFRSYHEGAYSRAIHSVSKKNADESQVIPRPVRRLTGMGNSISQRRVLLWRPNLEPAIVPRACAKRPKELRY